MSEGSPESEAFASTGGPPVKKFRPLATFGSSLPAAASAPAFSLDMLRCTRPPPRPQAGQGHGSVGVAPVEAWGTPTGKQRSGGALAATGGAVSAAAWQQLHGDAGGMGPWAVEGGNNPAAKEMLRGRGRKSMGAMSLDGTGRPMEQTQRRGNTSMALMSASSKLLQTNAGASGGMRWSGGGEGGGGDMREFDDSALAASSKGHGDTWGSGAQGGSGRQLVNVLPKLSLSTEEKRKNLPVGTLFERESPRAKDTLRSFLRNFMEESGVDLKKDINLGAHALATGEPITNAWIQEIAVMQTQLKSLNLANGREVTDVGLWALARHCTTIKGLNLSKCDAVTKVGLRSLSLRCQQLQELNLDMCAQVKNKNGRDQEAQAMRV